MKLNIGAGDSSLEGYIKIDYDSKRKPDLCTDIRFSVLPYEDDSVEEIVMFHTIEHIEKKHHVFLLSEFNRVLRKDGYLIITFPEFSKCAKNFIENYKGMREFWEATVFGSQVSKSDYYVCAMDSEFLRQQLIDLGFSHITIDSEINEKYNTILSCSKVRTALGREDVIREVVFDGKN
jgi:SAM-dependent methyltransferase